MLSIPRGIGENRTRDGEGLLRKGLKRSSGTPELR